MKTYSPKPGEIAEKWYLVDARGQVVGRLAAEIAKILRGKHMPTFAPHWNMGAHVVVINAERAILTGSKMRDKMYYRHTGWPGGLKAASAQKLNADKPGEVLREAIHGMLPKTRLGRAMQKRLRIFAGPNHDHRAQMPEPLEFTTQKPQE